MNATLKIKINSNFKKGWSSKRIQWIALWLLLIGLSFFPTTGHAADNVSSSSGGGLTGLYGVLDGLYDEMIPMAERLIGVARVLAGFAALWYIAVRVWRHIARAEPIDFYPLLRPFALGLVILFFMPMISLMNGILRPIDVATRSLAGDSKRAILLHIEHQQALANNPAPAGLVPTDNHLSEYEQPDGTGEIPIDNTDSTGFSAGLKSSFSFLNIQLTFKTVVVSLVNIIYEAAALCINTIRTFYLIILVILGPIVLGLSVFDGFKHTLSNWFARYINIYMWLPVANIFGAITSKILEHMLTIDQDFFSSSAYVIFMLIAIVGYTTVPSIASHIVHVAGQHSLLTRINTITTASSEKTVSMVKSAGTESNHSVRSAGGQGF